LEHLRSPRNDERYRLNVAVVDGLVTPKHLVLVKVNAALGQEGNASLGIGGLVLGQVLELVILILIVANVPVTRQSQLRTIMHKGGSAIPLSGKIQTLRSIIPERHADTRNGVKDLETPNRFRWVTGIPQAKLTIAHTGEASRGNAVMFTHPHSPAVLGSWVTSHFLRGLFLSHIPDTELLVPTSSHQQRPIRTPG
jgi:hypothetical protein